MENIFLSVRIAQIPISYRAESRRFDRGTREKFSRTFLCEDLNECRLCEPSVEDAYLDAVHLQNSLTANAIFEPDDLRMLESA